MKAWALLLAVCSASVAAADGERKILVQVNENARLRADAVVVEGRLCAWRYGGGDCNYPIRVSIEPRGEFLEVASRSQDRKMIVRVPLSRLPDLDLESVAINGHYRPHELVTVDIRFGEPVDCYANDDGRPRLSISLDEEDGSDAWITSHTSCEIHDEQIVGEPDG